MSKLSIRNRKTALRDEHNLFWCAKSPLRRLKRAGDQKSAAEIAADAEDARLAAEEDASCDSDTYSDSASGASEDEDDEGEDSASES